MNDDDAPSPCDDHADDLEQLGKLVEQHVEQLLEHCDAVQIFAQKKREDGSGDTISSARGGGLWFARIGQVRMWLIRHEAAETRDLIKPNPDED